MIIFSENSIEQVKAFFDYNESPINYTYIFGKEFIENRAISVDLFKTLGFVFTNKILMTLLNENWQNNFSILAFLPRRTHRNTTYWSTKKIVRK